MAKFDGTRPGPGRPKGSLNRWSKSSRDAITEVFEQLGGVEAMTAWAKDHPSDFYRGIYARLLPTKSEVEAWVSGPRSVLSYTDEELMAIIEQGGEGQGESSQGTFDSGAD